MASELFTTTPISTHSKLHHDWHCKWALYHYTHLPTCFWSCDAPLSVTVDDVDPVWPSSSSGIAVPTPFCCEIPHYFLKKQVCSIKITLVCMATVIKLSNCNKITIRTFSTVMFISLTHQWQNSTNNYMPLTHNYVHNTVLSYSF